MILSTYYQVLSVCRPDLILCNGDDISGLDKNSYHHGTYILGRGRQTKKYYKLYIIKVKIIGGGGGK